MVLVYLPTKLGDFVRANVGIHIPAPWVAYGLCQSEVNPVWCDCRHFLFTCVLNDGQ